MLLTQVAAKSEGEGVEFALRGGSGRKLVMVAKAAEVVRNLVVERPEIWVG